MVPALRLVTASGWGGCRCRRGRVLETGSARRLVDRNAQDATAVGAPGTHDAGRHDRCTRFDDGDVAASVAGRVSSRSVFQEATNVLAPPLGQFSQHEFAHNLLIVAVKSRTTTSSSTRPACRLSDGSLSWLMPAAVEMVGTVGRFTGADCSTRRAWLAASVGGVIDRRAWRRARGVAGAGGLPMTVVRCRSRRCPL